jgi:hypothetical protein
VLAGFDFSMGLPAAFGSKPDLAISRERYSHLVAASGSAIRYVGSSRGAKMISPAFRVSAGGVRNSSISESAQNAPQKKSSLLPLTA